MKNILTVDVEDWQQSTLDNNLPLTDRVCRYTEVLLDIMARKNVKGTFFILGLVGEKFPGLVKSICREGHEIASHGYSHRVIFSQTEGEFRSDIQKSLEILSGITGERIWGYRAPDFSIIKQSYWALDVLMEKGFIYDSSIFPTRLPRYGIPHIPKGPYVIKENGTTKLFEIPLSTYKIGPVNLPFAGGGYMRLYPYNITKDFIKRINIKGRPVVAYFHPYEIDPDEFQKINVKIPFKLRITQGLNRKKIKDRFKALLEDFEFVPIKAYLQSYKLSAIDHNP